MTGKRLRVHERRHTGKRPFNYSGSACAFTERAGHFSLHERMSHNGGRPSACSQCSAAFSGISTLRQHDIGVHSGGAALRVSAHDKYSAGARLTMLLNQRHHQQRAAPTVLLPMSRDDLHDNKEHGAVKTASATLRGLLHVSKVVWTVGVATVLDFVLIMTSMRPPGYQRPATTVRRRRRRPMRGLFTCNRSACRASERPSNLNTRASSLS
jgi:hypothetical protein